MLTSLTATLSRSTPRLWTNLVAHLLEATQADTLLNPNRYLPSVPYPGASQSAYQFTLGKSFKWLSSLSSIRIAWGGTHGIQTRVLLRMQGHYLELPVLQLKERESNTCCFTAQLREARSTLRSNKALKSDFYYIRSALKGRGEARVTLKSQLTLG